MLLLASRLGGAAAGLGQDQTPTKLPEREQKGIRWLLLLLLLLLPLLPLLLHCVLLLLLLPVMVRVLVPSPSPCLQN